jgi:hypothetical protein
MNDLNRVDLQILDAIGRERQSEMRGEAQNEHRLRMPSATRKQSQIDWIWTVAIALIAVLPLALVVVRPSLAAVSGG